MSPFDLIYSDPKDRQTRLENSNLFQASSKFIEDTFQNPNARARQAAALVEGCVVGGIKSIPDRIVNHPAETCNQILIGAGTGALFGMAAMLNAPIVTGALAVGGTAMTLAYTWDLGQRLGQDRGLQSSLDELWRNGDSKTYNSALPIIENRLGKEAFDCSIALLSAGAGARAAKLAAELICPISANLSLASAPLAMTENVSPSRKTPDNVLAMVWHRDRFGFTRDKTDPKTLESYIQKAPLSQRLDTIETAINKGELNKAYNHAEANLKWHQERSGSYDDEHDRLSREFMNIAMVTRNAWDTSDNFWLNKAREQITQIRKQFPNKTGWPTNLKVDPDNLTNLARLASTPLTRRVAEIQALVNHGMFKDAARLANTNCILHRTTQSSYARNNINDAPTNHQRDISDEFDKLFLHLHRMYDENLESLVPETSLAVISEHLAALKRI
ncbi:MAG: hypothetical protein EKK48_07885 [Candidatus Melainabacteria bacterium]|nr:MAG: hypothetical protein EKK48_07885 [Candidatus Melainabacteria bacterium]